MKKENIYKFFYVISIFLIICFTIRLGVDYSKYNPYSNSAPFYANVIGRIVEFIIPSIIVFIVGKIMKKKHIK